MSGFDLPHLFRILSKAYSKVSSLESGLKKLQIRVLDSLDTTAISLSRMKAEKYSNKSIGGNFFPCSFQ